MYYTLKEIITQKYEGATDFSAGSVVLSWRWSPDGVVFEYKGKLLFSL